MSRLIKQIVPVLFAIVAGIAVLAGYLFQRRYPVLGCMRDSLIKGAVIVAAFALFLGGFNVLHVHARRAFRRRPGWPYSLVLMLAMLIAWIPPGLKILAADPSIQETLDLFDGWIFNYVISPLGAAVAALVVFTLALAAFRLLRTRRSAGTALFLIVAAVVLLGTTPLTGLAGGLELLANVRDWIVNVPAMAGMRGLLLGVALGTIITALRVFLLKDRPYSEF